MPGSCQSRAFCERPAAVLAWFLIVLTGCASGTPPPISIGHVAPRGGPLRHVGLNGEKAMLLALEDSRNTETVPTNRPFEVRHVDSHDDPETAEAAAVRLLSINRVAGLIGGFDPASTERIARVAQQYKIPLLTPTWLSPSLLGNYGFCVGPTAADRGRALARLVLADQALQPAAVLVDSRSPHGLAVSAAFIEVLGNDKVVYRGEYSGDDTVAAVAGLAVAARPGSVVIAGNLADLEKLRTELENARLPPRAPLLFGDPEHPRIHLLAERWGDVSPLRWTTAYVPDRPSKQAGDFARKYQEKFGEPPDASAVLAHDAASLLFEAIRQAKTTRGEKVREELLKIKHFAALTGPLTFDGNQTVQRPVWVVARDGKPLPLTAEPAAKKSP